jgi:hypothetical protein
MLHAAIGVKPAAPVMAMSDKRCGWVSVIKQLYVAALRRSPALQAQHGLIIGCQA